MTLLRLLPVVYKRMLDKTCSVAKLLATLFTFVWLFTSVSHLVSFERTCLIEGCGADVTGEWLLSSVDSFVSL